MDTRRLLRAAAISFGVAIVVGCMGADGSLATRALGGSRTHEPPLTVTSGCRNRDDCGTPLKAGIRITFTGWACTIGFFARASATRKVYAITAGHCISNGGLFAQWSHHGTAIGLAALDAYEDGSFADAGAIEIEGLPVANVLVATSSSDIRPLSGTLPDAAQIIGSEVCRSGGTSGWTCGHIVAVDVDTRIAGTRIRHTWWTDFPSAGGDSGGPIVDRDGHLLGIIVAGTSSRSVYSTVDSIARELDLRPCVNVGCG